MVKQTLADVLVEQGVISADKIFSYQEEARKQKVAFDTYLTEHNLISPDALARGYAKLLSVSYLDHITDEMADPVLLGKVPLKFLRDHLIMPIKQNGAVVLVTANPADFKATDELQMIYGTQQIVISTQTVVVQALNHYYPLEGSAEVIEELEEEASDVSFEEIDDKDILGAASDAPIIKLVNNILFQAVKMEASDIHIEPEEKDVRVRYRIDGIMHAILNAPQRVEGALASRIKIMANLNIAEKRKPQDGRIEIKIADKAYDLRVSILPTMFGETIVMRILDKEKSIVELEKLGFSERDLKIVISTIDRPNGIIFVSGPTGSGKTTTLYSLLHRLNKVAVNIITVEDPVEYQLSGISQVQVLEKAGRTFATALRSILRQDPDIVMIGETRDQETAQIAVQAALTGHLVLSTIHTNNAPATVTRLVDMGIEPFLIASSIVLVVAQRLVRKLCNACKKSYHPSPEILKSLGLSSSNKDSFFEPVGCSECNNTGYSGRLAIFEVMQMSDDIARLTMEKSDATVIRKQALKDGMTLLIQDGISKIEQGLTSVEEVLSAATVYTYSS